MHPARALLSQVAWHVMPRAGIGLEDLRIADGKYAVATSGSRTRCMVFFRVGVPDFVEEKTDYSAALKTTLQQQRLRGMF